MLPSFALSILLSGVIVYGQSSGDQSATISTSTRDLPTPTLTDTGTTHTIAVGASGHKFTPGETKAKVGDTIEFKFYPVDHWVIRGDFNYPCIPYEYVGTDRRGFSSGEQAVQAITDDGPKFRVRVNDTEPIYFYCGAPGSCVRYHMMGVVNPTRNGTLEAWQEIAKDTDFQLRPGEPWPSEVDQPTALPTMSPEPSASNDSDDQDDHGKSSHVLSRGAIGGIVVGAVMGVLLIAGVIFLCLRRRGFSFTRQEQPQTVVTQVIGAPPGGPSVHGHSAMDAHHQKGPYQQAQQQQQQPPHQPQSFHQYGSPTTPPFSAITYGSYYPPPPPSVSPQPTGGNGTMSSEVSASYQDQLKMHLQSLQPNLQKPEGPSPVELPATSEQHEALLPQYTDPRFSWAGAEAEYRPSKDLQKD